AGTTSRPSRRRNSRQRVSRPAPGGRSHPRRHTALWRRAFADGKLESPASATSSPPVALVVLLVALVAVGLCATWLAYRRHTKQYARVDAQAMRAHGPDPTAAIRTKSNDSTTPSQTTGPTRDLTSVEQAERAFEDAVV